MKSNNKKNNESKINNEKDLKIAKLEKKIKQLQSQIINENDLNNIKDIEMNFFKTRDTLIQRITEFLFNRGFTFYIFGGYVRRSFEPYSNSYKRHKERMKSLNESDIDCIVEYTVQKNEQLLIPNLQNIVSLLHESNIINVIEITKYTGFVDDYSRAKNTYIMSFKVEYENNIIKFDMLNNIFPPSEQFKFQDYDVNELVFKRNIFIDEVYNKINTNHDNFSEEIYYTRNNLDGTFGDDRKYTPTIIKHIQNKIANPLFDHKIYITDLKTFNFCLRLIMREAKMIKEGYKITRKIKTSEAINSKCGVCMENITEDNIPLQICNCNNAKHNLCTDCISNTIKNNKTRCPFCRNQMKMETYVENKLKFPNIEICNVSFDGY